VGAAPSASAPSAAAAAAPSTAAPTPTPRESAPRGTASKESAARDPERDPSLDPSPSASDLDGDRPASPPVAGGKPRSGVSAGSLALMSALTFVTFSAVHSQGGSAQHNPGARALMSLQDDLPPVPESFSGLLQTLTETEQLWPALKPLKPLHDSAILLDDEAAGSASPQRRAVPPTLPNTPQPPRVIKLAPQPPSRVIRLPQNSSWSDALRFEALETRLAAAPRPPPAADPSTDRPAIPDPATERALVQRDVVPLEPSFEAGKGWSQPTRIYEPVWHADPLEVEDDDYENGDSSDAFGGLDAQRYIFCSRAYMFDATHRQSARRATRRPPSAPAAAGLDLPAAMPARFRHAAQQGVPQLTDGRNDTPASAALPTVQFLLPSAALHGVVGAAQRSVDATAGSDLLQVTCQVTNVSRVSS